jgi:hypothetical protein
MQRQETFGRRTAPQPKTQIGPLAATVPAPTGAVRPPPALSDMPTADSYVDVDRELEEWKAARKLRKRSFREPWRSVSIAAGLGFALSSWLLPDSVAEIAELVTTALCVASFYAGYRTRKSDEARQSAVNPPATNS